MPTRKNKIKGYAGGGMDASKSDFKASTTAKAPPSMAFGNPPTGSNNAGNGTNQKSTGS